MLLCFLQVLERWCESPRTIEVLMNTYSTMQLPEEAMALVPLETLQVRFQDPEHTLTEPGPKGLPLPAGKLSWFPQPAPEKRPRDPLMSQKKKTHSVNTQNTTSRGSCRHLLATSLPPALGGKGAICPRLPR